MNTTTHRPLWRITVAAFALAVTAGCGTELASAPADLPEPTRQQAPEPGDADQKCYGSPGSGQVSCQESEPTPRDGATGGLPRQGSGPEGWT